MCVRGLAAMMMLSMIGSGSARAFTEPAMPAGSPGDWRGVAAGLHIAAGSPDVRYSRSAPPDVSGSMKWSAAAWRGERVSGQFVVWSRNPVRGLRVEMSDLSGGEGRRIPAANVTPRFVRYVLGDGREWGDVLEPAGDTNLPECSTRPIWLAVDVPAAARPGAYRGEMAVRARGEAPVVFRIEVEVLAAVLPPPAEWSFYLDLWQNPWAVARYHGAKPWSAKHWKELKPLLRMLAEAGQKCLTATIVHRPWGGQTFDPMDSMVEWRKLRNGQWAFDYSLFDRYVSFAGKCGHARWINCYSLVPWEGIRYFDEKERGFGHVRMDVDDPGYRDAVGAFLADFGRHLRRKGWFGRTRIALDERPPETMLAVLALIRRHAPGLGVALAGADHPELYDSVDDYCFFISHRIAPEVIRRRAARGQPTTFYVCCGPGRPNTFTHSPPAESAWMGWFAAARGYTGFLRWAFNSWPEDPLADTSYPKRDWPAGDCFLAYPGPRSSIRFERLREGIQDYEKLRIVREKLKAMGEEGGPHRKELDRVLARFDYPDAGDDAELIRNVRRGRAFLNGVARLVY